MGAQWQKILQALLDAQSLGSGKKLELLRLNNEVEASTFPEEPLQVESTVLQELDVFRTNHFLLGHVGDGASGPSLEEGLVQVEEVAVAAFTFPRALLIDTFGLIDDASSIVLRV